MMTKAQEKLKDGFDRLRDAGNNPDLLGSTLLSFHGALEDHFRDVLEFTSTLPSTQRARIQDTRQVQWKELIDLMQQYHHLNARHKDWILSTNRFRQEFAHGGRFSGTRREVEKYGEFVRTQINGSGSSRPIVNRRQSDTSTHSTQAARSRAENIDRQQLDFSSHSIQAARLRAEKQFVGGASQNENRVSSANLIKSGCMSIGLFIFAVAIMYGVLVTLGTFMDSQRLNRTNVSVSDRLSASQTSKQDLATLAKYDLAIKRNPRNAIAYKKRADLKFKKLDDDLGALADYDRAIKLDPKYRQDAINNMRQAAKRSNEKTSEIIIDKLADWQVR